MDDEPALLQIHRTVLESAGYEIGIATDGPAAIELFRAEPYDAIITDLTMPEMDGLELIRNIRQIDLDVPVVIVTAAPTMDSAIRAVEYGALRYLLKPVRHPELIEVVERAVRLRKMAALKRQALALAGNDNWGIGDLAGLEAIFESALSKLFMVYQPIVSWSKQEVYAYEALVRTKEDKVPHPGVFFDTAERLDRLHELGAAIRSVAADPLGDTDSLLFINLHTADLSDETLYGKDMLMARNADRIVLEITERASLEGIKDLQGKMAKLRDIGYRIAVDDLGAGYAGLTSFSLLEPEVVKLDLTIVRDVHKSTTKQALIRSMVELCKEMEIQMVAEGVETAEERDSLIELGCDLFQGFFFARPALPFPDVNW